MRQSYYRAAMLWFGGIMTVIGILGFITQGATSGHHLVGLFLVGASFNVIYTATGVIGLLVAFAGDQFVRYYARVVAVVYAVWAVIGLFAGSGQVLGFIDNNGWDVALNAVVALVAAGIGWAEAPSFSDEPKVSSRDAVSFGEFQDVHRRRKP